MNIFKTPVSMPYCLLIKIPEPLEPVERGEKYDDPLQDLLEETGLGIVNGGGTKTDNDSHVLYCYLDIQISDLDQGRRKIAEFLETQGAPQGTRIIEYAPGAFLEALLDAS
jgi:hypothetical protein